MTDSEADQRSAPQAGERWLFSNGVEATIYITTDQNYGTPEIAYADPADQKTGFKFNAVHDPMPVRLLEPFGGTEDDAEALFNT